MTRRVESGRPLSRTARPSDYYLNKPAEPATGIFGVLVATFGLGIHTVFSFWALIVGVSKKQKFMVVTGILGIILTLVTTGVFAWLALKESKNFSFEDVNSSSAMFGGFAVSTEVIKGKNGLETKYPANMKVTLNSDNTLEFEHVSSTFGMVSADSGDYYNVSHLAATDSVEDVYRALTDLNNQQHYVAWSDFVNLGTSHSIKDQDDARQMFDVEFSDGGSSYRALIALKPSDGGVIVIIYSYPIYGKFNEKSLDDQLWRGLVDSVKLSEPVGVEE